MAAGLSCGAQCLKYLLFVFNFIIWILGGVILGLSIWLAADPTAKERFGIASDGNNIMLDIAVYTMIAIGAIIFILAFIGCCGAWQDNTCLLMWYVVILCILLVLEITAGILAAVFHQQIQANMDQNMLKQVKTKYKYDNHNDALHKSWDRQHRELSCCGAYGPFDWKVSAFANESANSGKPVPVSCCVGGVGGPAANATLCYADARKCLGVDNCAVSNKYLYTKGCSEGLQEWFKANSAIIIGVAFAIAGVQIFAIIFACCLRSSIIQAEYVV